MDKHLVTAHFFKARTVVNCGSHGRDSVHPSQLGSLVPHKTSRCTELFSLLSYQDKPGEGDNSDFVREALGRGSSQENVESLAVVWISHADTPGSPRSASFRLTVWECRYPQLPHILEIWRLSCSTNHAHFGGCIKQANVVDSSNLRRNV